MTTIKIVLVLFVALVLLPGTALADTQHCVQRGNFQLTSAGPWPIHISLKSGTACQRTFFANTSQHFKRMYIKEKPERGKLTLREGGFYIYSAPPTAGKDQFKLHVCGVQEEMPGCTDIQYLVNVE